MRGDEVFVVEVRSANGDAARRATGLGLRGEDDEARTERLHEPAIVGHEAVAGVDVARAAKRANARDFRVDRLRDVIDVDDARIASAPEEALPLAAEVLGPTCDWLRRTSADHLREAHEERGRQALLEQAQAIVAREPCVELESERERSFENGAHALNVTPREAARTGGPSLASLVSRFLVIDERPSQARYMVTQHLRTDDPVVRELERFVLTRVREPPTLDEMARATATSPRTLARKLHETLGTTPIGFARRLRIERAVHLLERTSASVEEVAEQVGYTDPGAFRRVLRRETGKSPREFRRVGR